jgi:hypothetical protein
MQVSLINFAVAIQLRLKYSNGTMWRITKKAGYENHSLTFKGHAINVNENKIIR